MSEPSTVRLGRLYAERARLDAEIAICERTVIEDIQRRQLRDTHVDLGREIVVVVAATMGVPDNFITTRDRGDAYVRARAVAYTVARRRGWSLPRIGAWAGRDHTSVMHSLNTYATDLDLMETVNRVYLALNRGQKEAS